MQPPSELLSLVVPFPRTATMEEWEAGRAARRALCLWVNDGRPLRREAGDPRKDALLRQLCAGERGLPFGPIQPFTKPLT